MGCHMEPAAVHIAHVLQKLHLFQFFNFFKNNLHHLPQKKLHVLTAEKINFLIIYTTYRKKMNTHIYRKKKLHDTTISFYTSYIFHPATYISPYAAQAKRGRAEDGCLGHIHRGLECDVGWCTTEGGQAGREEGRKGGREAGCVPQCCRDV